MAKDFADISRLELAQDRAAAKRDAVSKMVKVWESKNAKRALQGAGLSTMAVTLAACGGSSTTTTTTTPTTPVTPAPTPVSLAATTGADNLTGDGANDTFTAFLQYTAASINPAATTTLSAADTFNGAGGTGDKLTITIDGTPNGAVNLPTFSATGVEIIEVRNVSGQAATVEVGSAVGVTEVINRLSPNDVDFDDIGAADLTIVGNDAVTNGATTFSSGTASQTNAFTLNLKDGVGAGAITSNGTGDDWTAVTINSTGGTATSSTAANVVAGLDLAEGNTMQTLTINATTSLTTGAIVGWDTTGASTANKGAITVTGAGAVNIGALDAAVETLNASTNAGGVTATLNTQTDFQFTGSTGNDVITTGAVLSTSTAAPGSVNAGAGTGDRLVVAGTTHITSTVGAKYTNFEVLQVQDNVSVDLDHVAGITAVRINQGGNGTGVTDLSAAQAAAVTIVGSGAGQVTVGVKNAATLGQVDTVTLTINDGASTANDLVLTAPVLTGVENLVINAATDAVSVSALTSAAALTSIQLNATHASTVVTEIVSGAKAWGANSHIDASGSSAGVTINNTAGTTSAIRITGGSGNDTLTAATAVADIINGGGGIDTITVTDAGSTAVQLIESTVIRSADADLVVGFATTEDDFDYNGVLANGSGAAPTIAATEIAAAATTIAGALATADAANDLVFIATDALVDGTGTQATAIANFVTGVPTAAEASAVVDAIVGTGGALNGAITGLDSILGASDSVLFQFNSGGDTVVFRITNTDATGNTLTASEVQLVAVFDTAILVAADYI